MRTRRRRREKRLQRRGRNYSSGKRLVNRQRTVRRRASRARSNPRAARLVRQRLGRGRQHIVIDGDEPLLKISDLLFILLLKAEKRLARSRRQAFFLLNQTANKIF